MSPQPAETVAKRRAPDSPPNRSELEPHRFTTRSPPWTYLKLQLVLQPGTSSPVLDALTARKYLTSALSQFLGLTGTAIPIDILKIDVAPESELPPNILWVRVPREDAPAVVSALSSWIGNTGIASGGATATSAGGSVAWRICAKGNFLSAIVAGSGDELFRPA